MARSNFRPRENTWVESGMGHEHDLLGTARKDREILQKYLQECGDRCQGEATVTGMFDVPYLPYDLAIEHAKETQPESKIEPGEIVEANDPENDFLSELQARLAEDLEESDYGKIQMYTAVGTPLDKYHGVDGFIEYQTPKGVIRVTFDVTLRKKDNAKADVVIGEFQYIGPSDKRKKLYGRKDVEASEIAVHQVARKIERQIKTRMDE